jgi:hypothetical protein
MDKKALLAGLIVLAVIAAGCVGPADVEEETCVGMTLAEAKEIAMASNCSQGTLKDTYMCNNYTNTWWLDLDIEKEGCSPACVVNTETKEAEINWRCTGAIPPVEAETADFSANDEEQGWYWGDLDQKKVGTPETWIHKGEGTRSAQWFNPVKGTEEICDALKKAAPEIVNTISSYCEDPADCARPRQYLDSLEKTDVYCFNADDEAVADYDYLAQLYIDFDCPAALGGAPEPEVVACDCFENECVVIGSTD